MAQHLAVKVYNGVLFALYTLAHPIVLVLGGPSFAPLFPILCAPDHAVDAVDVVSVVNVVVIREIIWVHRPAALGAISQSSSTSHMGQDERDASAHIT